MKLSDRRNFLKSTLIGTAALTALPSFLSANETEMDSSSPRINGNSLNESNVILFQGDSITDAGRKRESKDANNQSALGGGYAFLAAAEILRTFATKNFNVFNKGISGNKVYQLAERWQTDCLDLKPSVLSILIGVNDYWHKHNGNYAGTVEIYEKDFRALLVRTKEALPNVKLVICEPFAVLGCKAVDRTWFPEFDLYRTYSGDTRSRFPVMSVHCLFKND